MPKFSNTRDYNYIICPYCGWKYKPESKDYSEDRIVEKCEECEKKFYSHQVTVISHHGEADCELNGEEHDWVANSLGDGKTHDFCSVCDKCKPY